MPASDNAFMGHRGHSTPRITLTACATPYYESIVDREAFMGGHYANAHRRGTVYVRALFLAWG